MMFKKINQNYHNIIIYIFLLLLFLNLFRGFIPIILFNNDYNFYIYSVLYFFLLFFLILNLKYITPKLNDNNYFKIIYLNFFLFIFYFFVTIIINFNISRLELVFVINNGILILYIILIIRKIPLKENLITNIFIIISIVQFSYFYYEYFLLNLNYFISDSYRTQPFWKAAVLTNLHSKFEYYTNTRGILRPVSFLDSFPHYSAYLNSILFIYWYCKSITFEGKNKFYLFLCFIGFISVLLNAVPSIAIPVLILFLFIIFFFLIEKKCVLLNFSILFIFFLLLLFAFLTHLLGHDHGIVLYRRLMAPQAYNFLRNGFQDITSISFIKSIILGHTYHLNTSNLYHSEFSFIKNLSEIGIFHFIIFELIIIYPLFKYLKKRNLIVENSQYFFVAIVFLFAQLHYGTLFRTKLILLELLVLAKLYMNYDNSKN